MDRVLEDQAEVNEPANFDEAAMAANEMFARQAEQQEVSGDNGENNDDVVENNIADVAAPPAQEPPPQQPAVTPELMLNQMHGELQMLRQQNQQLQQALQQQSDVQRQNIVEEVLAPPQLDLSNIAFDDENTIAAKQNDYAMQMAEYMKKTMMKDLSPFIQQAKDGIAQKEKSDALASLSALPDMQDLNEMLPQIENIIAKNNALASSDMPVDEKYVTAYLIASGINAKGKKNEMTAEKFMEYYDSNQELRDIIDKRRVQEIKGGQGVPPLSASNGAVNAALNIPKTPTNFSEAHELSKKLLGL